MTQKERPGINAVPVTDTHTSRALAVAAVPGKAPVAPQRLVPAAAQAASVLRQELKSGTHRAVPHPGPSAVQAGRVTGRTQRVTTLGLRALSETNGFIELKDG